MLITVFLHTKLLIVRFWPWGDFNCVFLFNLFWYETNCLSRSRCSNNKHHNS